MRKFLVFLILAVILWLSSLSFASNSRAADSDDYVSNILSQRPEKDPWSPIPDANNTGVFWEIFNTPSYIGEYRAIRVRVTPIAPDSALRDLPNGKKLRSASILYLVNCQNIAFAKKSVGSFSKPFTQDFYKNTDLQEGDLEFIKINMDQAIDRAIYIASCASDK